MTPPIHVLNLEKDVDRLALTGGGLAAIGLTFTRFNAYLGTAIPDRWKKEYYDNDGDRVSPLKDGEIGCYTSHLGALAQVLESDSDTIVVMEDDLTFHPRIVSVLDDLSKLPEDWDILRLSNPPKSAYVPVATIGDGFELVKYSRIPNTAGGYVANRRFAEAFIAHRGIRHIMIDEEMRRPWRRGFVTYGVVPPPVTVNVLEQSSIDLQGDRQYRSGLRLSANTTLDPGEWIRRIRFNRRHLTPRLWWRCLARNIAVHLKRRLTGKRPPAGEYSHLRVAP